MTLLYRTSKTYNALPIFELFPTWSLVPPHPGPRRPPHVRTGRLALIAKRAAGHHWRNAVIAYHARTVRIYRKRPRNGFWNATNLRIRGCNYFYFRNSFYPDADILGRTPTETDVANGAPLGPPGWPNPSGYQ